jgi:hypothetical protein
MKIRPTARTSAILLILVLAFPATLMVSCDPVDLFAEYRGVNLINSFQFGEELVPATIGDGWEADWGWNEGTQATDPNNYMTFAPPAAPDLALAGTSGLPATAPDGDAIAVYRLEVLNQFANGDFETGGSEFLNFSTDLGTPTRINPATDELGIDESIQLDSGFNSSQYVDLSLRVNTWAAASEYVFHFEYYPLAGQPFYLQFDDGVSDSVDYLFQITIAERSNSRLSFPGVTAAEKGNYLQVSPNYRRWYFGRVDAQTSFDSQIDSIRFVRLDTSYAARLTIPYADPSTGLTLVQGGSYEFSIYVHREDDRLASAGGTFLGTNRFLAQNMNITIRDIYGGVNERTTVSRDFDLSGLGSDWVKITLQAENLVKAIPSDPTEPMIEIAITASALSSGTASSYALDAGSVLVALPLFELGD